MGRKTTTEKINKLEEIIEGLKNDIMGFKEIINSREISVKQKDIVEDKIEEKENMLKGIIDRIRRIEEKEEKRIMFDNKTPVNTEKSLENEEKLDNKEKKKKEKKEVIKWETLI